MIETKLIHGDCLEKLKELADCSVDSVVTDPPYGLSFMGKKWDYDVPSVEVWKECLRVLKPGGHLLAFAGTRTQHRMAVRIEDAGFEIRDMIAWVYGSGFPKSLDVSKAIDKAAGAERKILETRTAAVGFDTKKEGGGGWSASVVNVTAPATEAARQWQGWGTALKPALEPITVARKPLVGTVAANVLTHGTGALNIDGCRIGTTVETWPKSRAWGAGYVPGGDRSKDQTESTGKAPNGRWPANLIHDGSDEVTKLLNDAARFFYCAKASKKDRDEGCEGLEKRELQGMDASPREGHGEVRNSNSYGNHHPTVKPTALMRYLCRLVTPPSGIVLDPFMGSGSTGKAAAIEGFNFIGIEREESYMEIAQARINPAKTPA
jgi:site-specific DNA-methyltransferase (adenine-specific)